MPLLPNIFLRTQTHAAALMACVVFSTAQPACAAQPEPLTRPTMDNTISHGFVDACQLGFSASASGVHNQTILQQALDQTGTIIVSQLGTYQIAGTVLIGSHTSLIFGNNVFLKKSDEVGPFSHVLLNRGALTKSWDEHISVTGLQLIVNGVDVRKWQVFGLHGQVAFFYAKDIRVERFRCLDLGKRQYGIQVCTFEDLIIDDIIIRGDKDGVHLGRGQRFTIRNAVFNTYDDAIALNAHDYDVGNHELGWIENGIIENCHDEASKATGFFCRILAGAWVDWHKGMELQKSDTVVSNGRLYRVSADPDEKKYISITPPTHERGNQVLDGITWAMVQNEVTYTAGVRNVIFRHIFLAKPRTAFSVHFDNDKYSRSYYPGARIPQQEQLTFENIRVLHHLKTPLINIATPVDVLTISNSSFRDNAIRFISNRAMTDYLPTQINIYGCVFNHSGTMELVTNTAPGKTITLKTSANVAVHDQFRAIVSPGLGTIKVKSDLAGLE